MRAWFEGLEPRERLLVGLGAAAAILIVLWAFVWTPLARGVTESRTEVDDKRALVVAVQRAAAADGGAAAGAPGASTQSLVVLVDRTAGAGGLAAGITATRPDGADGINVSFQNAAFDAIVDWLLMLEQTHGVRVESASFTGARETGLVSGQVLLRRG